MDYSIVNNYCHDLKKQIIEDNTLKIEKHLRFVIYIVNKLQRKHSFPIHILNDLVQAGNLGLLRAYDLYDPTRGVKFTSYAINWIMVFIKKELHFFKYPLKIGMEKIPLLEENPIRCIDINEISESKLVKNSSDSIDEKVFKNIIKENMNRILNLILTEKELKVIKLRFYDGLSLSETGQKYNKSKQRIHQIQNIALSKLKSNRDILDIMQMYMDLLAA